jgi:hypothetical protein
MTLHAQETPDTSPIASPAERIRRIRALEQSPAWHEDILPVIEQMLEDHQESAIRQSSTPDQRAEHIEAVHALRKIVKLPHTLSEKIASARRLEATKGRHQ